MIQSRPWLFQLRARAKGVDQEDEESWAPVWSGYALRVVADGEIDQEVELAVVRIAKNPGGPGFFRKVGFFDLSFRGLPPRIGDWQPLTPQKELAIAKNVAASRRGVGPLYFRESDTGDRWARPATAPSSAVRLEAVDPVGDGVAVAVIRAMGGKLPDGVNYRLLPPPRLAEAGLVALAPPKIVAGKKETPAPGVSFFEAEMTDPTTPVGKVIAEAAMVQDPSIAWA